MINKKYELKQYKLRKFSLKWLLIDTTNTNSSNYFLWFSKYKVKCFPIVFMFLLSIFFVSERKIGRHTMQVETILENLLVGIFCIQNEIIL